MNNENENVTFFINRGEDVERIEQEVEVPSGVDNQHPENYYG